MLMCTRTRLHIKSRCTCTQHVCRCTGTGCTGPCTLGQQYRCTRACVQGWCTPCAQDHVHRVHRAMYTVCTRPCTPCAQGRVHRVHKAVYTGCTGTGVHGCTGPCTRVHRYRCTRACTPVPAHMSSVCTTPPAHVTPDAPPCVHMHHTNRGRTRSFFPLLTNFWSKPDTLSHKYMLKNR